MRELVVTAFVSADGVMEGPGGGEYHNAGWTFKGIDPDPAMYAIKERETAETTALLLGRRTYEEFAPVWPTMDEFEEYNRMPRYVVSSTLTSADERWPATVLSSMDEVADLKSGDGGTIAVHGSAALAASLADADLVDRYHILEFPVLLGSGKRLFSDTRRSAVRLQLTEHETYSNGVQMKVYTVVR